MNLGVGTSSISSNRFRRNHLGSRLVPVLILAGLLSACLSTPITRYEGENSTRHGQGGSRESIDGIDFWTNGDPPRRYQIIGYTTVESSEGRIGNRILLSRVAAKVQHAGGDAAIRMGERSKSNTAQQIDGITYFENKRIVDLAIIRYR